MTEQEENELICEKLLGWKRIYHDQYFRWVLRSHGLYATEALSFTTWADAGLILEALSAKETFPRLEQQRGSGNWFCDVNGGRGFGDASTGPLAIRGAALEYIKAVKS